VSTSEAAKQLLESSKEERLELVKLLSEPTDSLLNIRRKAASKVPLSQAEWTLVAYYCLQGAEMYANTAQTEISFDSLAAILEAFQAVYGLLRKKNKTHLDSFFIAHLPSDAQAEGKSPDEIGSEDVRRAVTHTLRMLKNQAEDRQRPIFVARNLYFLLDELEVPGRGEAEPDALALLANLVARVRAWALFSPRPAPARSELSRRGIRCSLESSITEI
jgi:hypothetical protein